MEEIEDLSKMKVADLKKHLKNRGLPITGNKTELVDRLQEALQSALADANPTLDSSGVVDDEEFDEEEILGGDDVDIKITQEEEAAALAGNIKVKNDSILLTETVPEKKKISLKRSEPCLSFPAETTTTTAAAVPEEDASAEPELSTNSNTNDKENSLTSNSEEPKRKVIKLTGLNSEDAAEARAKKFGTVTNNESEGGRKEARAARFGVTESNDSTKNKKAPKLSMETGGTDLEKLKKRAERFGEVTSKSLSKLEMLEKMKKRQERFSSESSDTEKTEKSEKKSEKTSETDNEAAKTARANRFGTSTENGKKTPITAPASEDDAKAKRAQRFAV